MTREGLLASIVVNIAIGACLSVAGLSAVEHPVKFFLLTFVLNCARHVR